MNFRHLIPLCLLWASTCSLIGCGGAASTGSINTLSTTVEPGIYYNQINGQNFYGVITPANWGNNWYALHYAAINPDIYSGSLAGSGTATAAITTLKYFQNTAATVLTGSASMRSAGAGQLSGDLNLVTTTPPYKQDLSFTATTPISLNYNQAAQWGDIANSWTGRLSYGLGSNAAFTLNIAPNTGLMSAGSFGVDCQWTSANSLVEASPSVNMFKVKLTMAISTACDFKGQTLTGVAFVLKNPEAGVNQRLIWLATTPEGKGISFKADR
jgi:hypothetical protein